MAFYGLFKAMKNYAALINSYGSPEVLEFRAIAIPKIERDEVLIRHTHAGLNYIDTYFRTGLYKTPPFPVILGAEAAGVIEDVGTEITDFKIGDRVCYTGGLGAYCKYRAMKTETLIKLPDEISNEIAAACLLKGLTAHYLLRKTFEVEAGQNIFYHAAAGGVGLILGQWAKALGAKAIGTAGSQEKCELAIAHGFDHVINYRDKDFVAEGLKLNGGKFDVVYDGVGKDTFMKSLDLIKPLGMMVCFGQSSGPVPPFDINILNQKGSLYLTRPSLFAYVGKREQLLENSAELFDIISSGKVRIEINQRFKLSEIAEAHRQLENRLTTGTTIIEIS